MIMQLMKLNKFSEFTRQIKKAMAENNLSFKDAESKFPKKSFASVLKNNLHPILGISNRKTQ